MQGANSCPLPERRLKAPSAGWSQQASSVGSWPVNQQQHAQHGYDPYYDN